MRNRWFGGVASGIAAFLGLDFWPVRMMIRFLFLFTSPIMWWAYLLLWLLLPAQKLYQDDYYAKTHDYKQRVEREYKYKQKKYEYKHKKHKKSPYKSKIKVEVKRIDFDNVLEISKGRVSKRVYKKIESIDESVRALKHQLNWWSTLRHRELATVKRSAYEYFPRTVAHYLQLPRSYAENHKLINGMTPEAKLYKDLSVLDETLDNVMESLYNNDKINLPNDLKELNESMGSSTDPIENIQNSLDELVERIEGKVDYEVLEKVKSIRSSLVTVLPQIDRLSGSLSAEAYNVRHTALEYLPDALDKFLSLPTEFTNNYRLSNGKTAKETLLEQLDLLDNTMKDIIGDLYQEDADNFLVHGRFLKEKFADQKFTIPDINGNPKPKTVTRVKSDESTDYDREKLKFPEIKIEEKIEMEND